MELTLNEKAAFFLVLLNMASTDNEFAQGERVFFNQVMTDLNVGLPEKAMALKLSKEQVESIIGGMQQSKKIKLKELASKMAEVDGILHPAELVYLTHIINVMGLGDFSSTRIGSVSIPNLRGNFKNDLAKNFEKLSRSYTKNLYMADIEKEAIMYAMDICLEFKNKAGFLTQDVMTQVTDQVCDVISDFFDGYTADHRLVAKMSVVQNMALPNAKEIVRQYQQTYY